jgi:hypothetical protein
MTYVRRALLINTLDPVARVEVSDVVELVAGGDSSAGTGAARVARDGAAAQPGLGVKAP